MPDGNLDLVNKLNFMGQMVVTAERAECFGDESVSGVFYRNYSSREAVIVLCATYQW